VTAGVYFDFGSDRQFPSVGWNDFVIVISRWWLAALEALVREAAESDLLFMDGPYRITAIATGPGVLLRCKEVRTGAEVLYEVAVGLEDLKREVVTFACQLSNACAQANIQSTELDKLRRLLARGTH